MQVSRRNRALPTLAKRSLAKLFYEVGPNQLWPTPTLAKLSLANTKFGQTIFGEPVRVGGGRGRGPKGEGGARTVGPRRREGDEPRNMGPQRAGPRRVGPLRWGAQHFAFFFPLPPQFSFSLPSLAGLLVEFWWFFEALGPSNVNVWALGLSWVPYCGWVAAR